MAQVAQRVQARQRRPEAAARRPATAEAQRSRTMAKPKAHPAAPVAAAVAERVSQPVAARTRDPGPAHPLGLPPQLQSGVEALSGLAMDDVRVHRNSPEPAKLGALAYTQGTDIHLGPGQEEHLPHEAWHVVQQKQGRVRATTQMKGVALNVDPTLEAEADQLGDRANSNSRLNSTDYCRKTATNDVIQRTVRWKNGLYLKSNVYMKAAAPLVDSKHPYYMRDNSDIYAKEFHILDGKKYYILGDDHNASQFRSRAEFWQNVPHMHEDLSEIAGDKGEFISTRDFSDLDPSKQLKALQDAPLVSLQACMNVLNGILGLKDRVATIPSKNKKDTKLSQSEEEEFTFYSQVTDLDYIGVLPGDQIKYTAFFNRPRPKTPYYEMIRSFKDKLLTSYKGAIAAIVTINNDLQKEMDYEIKTFKFVNLSVIDSKFGPSFKSLDKHRPVIKSMIDDLTKIVGISKTSPEGVGIAALASTKAKYNPKETDILMKARDKDMVKHIEAAGPPLLVSVGQDHLPGILAVLKTKAIGVNYGEDFEKVTKFP